jgi:hypothetical protein
MNLETVFFSPAYTEKYSSIPFSVGYIQGLQSDKLKTTVASAKPALIEAIHNNQSAIEHNIELYTAFSSSFDSVFPVARQYQTWLESEMLKVPPLIELLMLAEFSSGVLLGIQDFDSINGTLVCDLAESGESFIGIRDTVYCKAGDFVIKDADGIIASYSQGPDAKTKLQKHSSNLVIFGFHAPGIDETQVVSAMNRLMGILTPIGKNSGFKICYPAQ